MEEEQLVLVDEEDREVGTAGKLECHVGAGRLHRAFTALVVDSGSRLLLARRSATKMLWPGAWDATFASHPRPGEGYGAAATRRMPDELGVSCTMELLFRFVYRAEYLDVGTENEVCATLVGTLGGGAAPEPNADEISEVSWEGPRGLASAVRADARAYCPWMLAAIWLIGEAPHPAALAPWAERGVREAMREGVRAHMDDAAWRMVGA